MSAVTALARWLHENYEEIAANEGWETQDGTSVDFDDLPDDNRRVMLRLASRLLYEDAPLAPADHCETVREVKLENAKLTVHVPPEADDIHEAIEDVDGARHIDDYDIVETYEIEAW